MGMYDELICEYPLPDAKFQDRTFQTKSADCQLEMLRITVDGRCVKVSKWAHGLEDGGPEWMLLNGAIVFYAWESEGDSGSGLHYFEATFKDGLLDGIIDCGVAPTK